MSIVLDGTNGITTPDLAVDTNTLFVDAVNNRVGVGTSSPTERLTVAGNGQFTQDTYGFLGVTSGSVQGQLAANADGAVQVRAVSDHPLSFFTNNTERARIDTVGRMLVGTTTATQFGTTQATIVAQHFPGVQAAFKCVSTSTGASAQVRFVNPNGEVGSISTNEFSTAYNTSSDYRLKEDVQPMVGAVDRVLSLKPVNFAWKADGSRVDGFLAHEAQAVVPEAVHGTKDEVDADGKPVYQGIDQSKLVPLLTAALQEALQTIKALEARVAALETPA